MGLKEIWKRIYPTKPDTPAHVRGVIRGNATGSYERQRGHLPEDKSNAQRSTGIYPQGSEPIVSDMPNISPP